jgi:hypothetical protein
MTTKPKQVKDILRRLKNLEWAVEEIASAVDGEWKGVRDDIDRILHNQ